MPKASLCQRFIDGLNKHNLTLEEVNDHWRYAWGNQRHHLNYLLMLNRERVKKGQPEFDIPPHTDKCICQQRIIENSYITDWSRWLVFGRCYIEHFLKKTAIGPAKCAVIGIEIGL